MKGFKDFTKRLSILALTAAMIMTMAPSVQSDASEAETENQTEVQNEQDTVQEQPVINDAEQNPSGEADNTADNQTDTTKPVIEKVEFPRQQQGATLKEGDTAEVYIYAYDNVGIERVDAELQIKKNISATEISYDEAKGCYVAKWKLDNVVSGKACLSRIRVVDKNKNYTDWGELYEEGNPGVYKYWFNIEKEETARVKEFLFPNNGIKLNMDDLAPDTLPVTVKTESVIEDKTLYAHFEAEDGKQITLTLPVSPGDESGSNFVFDGGISWTSNWSGTAEYTLKRVYADRMGGQSDLQMEGMEQYKFTVVRGDGQDKEKPVITSVEMEKKGEIARAGDKLTITVKAEDNSGKLNQYGSASLHSAADIDNPNKWITLEDSDRDGVYQGVFPIEEDTYPCEWYIEVINISDEAGNTAEYYDYCTGGGYPYYVNVYNGNTFIDNVSDCTVNILSRAKNGVWQNISVMQVKNAGRRSTLKSLGVTLPKMESKIEGLTQTGWQDYAGNPVTEDTILLSSGYTSIYAQYDKNCVAMNFSYMNKEGKWKIALESKIFEKGTTYGELLKDCLGYTPEDMTEELSFEKWEYNLYQPEDMVIPEVNHNSLSSMRAKYSDKKILPITKLYYDTEGRYYTMDGAYDALIVDMDTTSGEVIQMLKEQPLPKMYSGLKFKEWDISLGSNSELQNGAYVSMNAIYDNCMIRYCIDPIFEDEYIGGWADTELDTIVCQVAEKGEKITVPKSFDGYESVTWTYRPVEEDSFTVENHMVFRGYGTKKGEEKPDEPDTPVAPDVPDTPDQGTPLPQETIDSIVDIIENSKDGKSVQVEMGNATVVPKEILESAKGKDVDIKLNMGGYTWTINGKDILASNLNDINLEVKFDTNQIPGDVVKQLAGDNPVKQISLTHNGDFGFNATLTINAGQEYKGKYGNLFYYDSDGKMVFMNAGRINEDGTVSVGFSHASDYLLVISEKKMSQSDVPAALGGSSGRDGKVKTGDSSPVIPVTIVLLAAAFVIIASAARLKKQK